MFARHAYISRACIIYKLRTSLHVLRFMLALTRSCQPVDINEEWLSFVRAGNNYSCVWRRFSDRNRYAKWHRSIYSNCYNCQATGTVICTAAVRYVMHKHEDGGQRIYIKYCSINILWWRPLTSVTSQSPGSCQWILAHAWLWRSYCCMSASVTVRLLSSDFPFLGERGGEERWCALTCLQLLQLPFEALVPPPSANVTYSVHQFTVVFFLFTFRDDSLGHLSSFLQMQPQ